MRTTAATRAEEYSAVAPVLRLAFELGQTKWKLGFTTGLGPRERTLAAIHPTGRILGLHRTRPAGLDPGICAAPRA